jgi:hypothetical protein
LVRTRKPAGIAAAADTARDEETHVVLLRRMWLLLLGLTRDCEQQCSGDTKK